MNIDDLKSLMDGFDPASILPELDSLRGNLDGVIRFAVMAGPVILLVLGILYLVAAPKEANYHFGYRCYFGMGSVDAWRFTQRLAGLIWSALGLALTVIMFFVSAGFAGMETMDMLWAAVKCVLWEAVLVAAACIFINVSAALRFDAKGERRKAKVN